MSRPVRMAGVCALSFGVAFAAGSMTRDTHRARAISAASAPTPVRIAGLAAAPRLPRLHVTVAPRKRSPVQRRSATVATVANRPTPSRPARVVAQTPHVVSAPAPTTRPAPTPAKATPQQRPSEPATAASGPSVTFFDEGD
jgi:hypothetical protein